MGRILGLDFGTKRIGAAISDPRRQIASPLEVYQRRDSRQDQSHYRKLVEEESVSHIVVGLPLHTGGGEGDLAVLARRFGAWMAEITGLSVSFYDERYTTHDAEQTLRDAGKNLKDRKALRDMLAAQILLANYLEAGCPTDEIPNAPLDDVPEAP